MSEHKMSEPNTEDGLYEPKRRLEDAADLLARFRAEKGIVECTILCREYILNEVDNKDNDLLSLIISKLFLDDFNYFSFMLLGVQKEKPISEDDLQMLRNLLSKFNQETQTFYALIIPALLNTAFDINKRKIYINIKKELFQEYIKLNI